MSASKPMSLPEGLPAHLCAGNEGYRTLCTLLGINTTRVKQDVINVPAAKRFLSANRDAVPRHGRQSERLRRSLVALYGDPATRRESWRAHSEHVASGENGRSAFPSLEHAALSAYDDDVLTAEPDRERLADCAQFHTSGPDDEGRRTPALAALPHVKNDFTDWASVPPERKPRVIAAAFAVASLLDDPRLLHWAAAREPDIEQAYAFLDPTGTTEVPLDPLPEAPPDDTEPSTKLRARATALSQAANDLATSQATVALFDVLAERHADVLDLREAVLAQTNTKAIDDLLTEFADLLEAKAEIAPWLGGETERLLADWRSAYPPTESDLEAIRADVDRAAATLDASLSRAASAETEADKAKSALDHHMHTGGSSRADIKRQAALSADAAVADQAFVDAVDDALTALEPIPTERAEGQPAKSARAPDDPEAQPDSGAAQTAGPEAPVPPDSHAKPTPRADSSRGPEEQASPKAETPDPADAPSTGATPHGEAPTGAAPTETASDQDASSSNAAAPEPGAPAPSVQPPPPEVDQPEVVTAHVDDPPKGAVAPIPETETFDADELSPAQASLWRAVGNGRIGLAHHIARLDNAGGEPQAKPSPELLAAVALGSVLGSPPRRFGQRVRRPRRPARRSQLRRCGSAHA